MFLPGMAKILHLRRWSYNLGPLIFKTVPLPMLVGTAIFTQDPPPHLHPCHFDYTYNVAYKIQFEENPSCDGITFLKLASVKWVALSTKVEHGVKFKAYNGK